MIPRSLLIALLVLAGERPAAAPAQSSAPATATAPSPADAALTEIQRVSIRYFYDFGHPVSGLARESSRDHGPDVCAIGATGMGCFNLIVGVERGFLTRYQAASRMRTMLRFLSDQAERFHGAYPHWLNGRTGQTIPFSPDDDGADLVETSYLAQGLLALREYFTGPDALETEIRRRADQIWRDIEWDFFVKESGPDAWLLWHWSPRVGWKMNHRIAGFNECHITYLLALASPTHAAPPRCYWRGWHNPHFARPREHFGIPVLLGERLEMPLFFIHYSYLGFDPHALSYQGKTYFEHFQDLCRVQIAYAKTRRAEFEGYGPLWGLTASLGPDGYRAFAPGREDHGTIAPTAALSSLPYTPRESLAFLLELNRHHRPQLWGPYGYVDAFNLTRRWKAKGYLGIDVGPIAPMIENHRTGLCWRTFMNAPEIVQLLKTLRESEPAAGSGG